MYYEKMEPILKDLENKEIDIAGGSVVGMILATTNSLITYIANLTVNKKNYEEVQDEILKILSESKELKTKALQAIDKDKEILEEILDAYKSRKENGQKYQEVCKKSTEFCMEVLSIANSTLELSDRISKAGNKMLASDFKICKYYATASVWSAVENVYINLKDIDDEQYKNEIEKRCEQILQKIKI